MKRIRLQDDEPSVGSIAAGVTLGALAGFVVGIVVAQKVGGIAGLSSRIREKLETLTHRGDGEGRMRKGTTRQMTSRMSTTTRKRATISIRTRRAIRRSRRACSALSGATQC
jgi:hypothetical protein